MKATVDANIFFSALLRKGITKRIWFDMETILYAPAFLLDEFYKHEKFLKNKFRGTINEFNSLSQKLLSQICFIPNQELSAFLPAAKTLSKYPEDWIYLACALKQDTIIWSNDKEFKKQSRIKAKTTTELMQELGFL
jgi:predicted nucleic acid-binding protein